MRKITFEEVQSYIEENDVNKDCTLLSNKSEYVNSKTKMIFKCNCCGKDYQRNFTDVKRNSSFKCTVCAQGRRLTIEQVRDFINKNDVNKECELLSTQYINYDTPLLFKCNCCGKDFERKFSQVKEKHFACFECLKSRQGGKNKLNIQKVREFIQEYDIENNCELLSTNYINQSEPLLFKCNCCGKEFERTFQTLKAKKTFKCFRCAHHLPMDSTSDKYLAIVSYFRGKTYSWKKEFLKNHNKCDLTGVTEDLHVHHLISFSTILEQASINAEVPLDYRPSELEQYGYSLEKITNEFLKLHNSAPAVLLTKDYHNLFHKLYGYKDNTPAQYFEFKERFYKGEFN